MARESNKDPMNLLEDEFADFCFRTSRTSRLRYQSSMSPRLPSALPPSASPRVMEPLTPDRQPVLPYFSPDDAKDLALPCTPAASQAPAHKQASSRRGKRLAADVGVVDEEQADVIFAGAQKRNKSDPLFLTLPSPSEFAPTSVIPFSSTPTVPPISSLSLLCQQRQQKPPSSSTSPKFEPKLVSPSLILKPPESTAPSSRPTPSPGVLAPHLSHAMSLQLPDDLPTLRPLFSHMLDPSLRRNSAVSPSQSSPTVRPTPSTTEHTSNISSSASTLAGSLNHPLLSSTENDSESSSGTKNKKAWRSRAPSDEWNPQLPNSPSSSATPGTAGRNPQSSSDASKATIDPLRCDLCGSRFARRSNLYKHKRSVHEDLRKYKCDICDYGFKRQDHLIKHKKSVHSKERKYACDFCGTAFAEKYNRQKHERVIHMTPRAYQCTCGAYFQHKEQMKACLKCKS